MQTKNVASGDTLDLRVGELVEVRSEAEIFATLDENGELDSLPFMPEMLQYCGRRFTVYKVAHKLCDTVARTGMRKMHRAVHLSGVRCDGQDHGGCQSACMLYWKQAWLKRMGPAGAAGPGMSEPAAAPHQETRGMNLPLLQIKTRRESGPDGEECFRCQATELLRAAPQCLPLRDLGQYVQDVRSGNVGVPAVLRAFFVGVFNRFQGYSKRVLPRRLWFRDGLRWRFVTGTCTAKTPTGHTNLQPGELVRIKSKEEIEKTLNKDLLNRGMGFEEEMSRYCGREARVLRRVDRIIDEQTGRLLKMKSPCIVLEGTICTGAYNANCPRAIYAFWREIWLERVSEPAS